MKKGLQPRCLIPLIFFVNKMLYALSAYYVCCIYSNAIQANFIFFFKVATTMNPDPTDMGPYYCNKGHQSKREKGRDNVMNSRKRGNKINSLTLVHV